MNDIYSYFLLAESDNSGKKTKDTSDGEFIQ